MSDSNVLLVKPKQGMLSRASDVLYQVPERGYGLYVPESFILRPIAEHEGGLVLKKGILLLSDADSLQLYKNALEDGGLEIVRQYSLPDTELEQLVEQAKATLLGLNDLSAKVRLIGNYKT